VSEQTVATVAGVVEPSVAEREAVTSRINALVEAIATMRAGLGVIDASIAARQGVIDADGDEDEVLVALRERKALRGERATAQDALAAEEAKLKAEGDGALSGMMTRVDTLFKAYTALMREARADAGKRAELHAALDTLLDQQTALDTFRAALGIEPEKGKRSAAERATSAGTDRAPAGQVYVTKDGDLSLYLGPEAGEYVIGCIEGVEGALVKDAKRFKWGERANSWDLTIASSKLAAVRQAAIAGRDALGEDAPKEQRRAFRKVVQQTGHILDGNPTEQRV
jgi:hypothetical protein